MKKRIVSIVAIVIMVFTMLPILAIPASAETEYYIEGDFTYTVKDGKATLVNYTGQYSGNLEIPEKLGGYPLVAIVGFDCTEGGGFSQLSVTIPDSVTYIGEWAFAHCEELSSIIIPDSVTIIDKGVFQGCRGLKEVTLSKGITAIEDYTFSQCDNLTFINIPDSVTYIGVQAFNGCDDLISITIPNGVDVIEANSFNYCTSLTDITIPESVTLIGRGAFSGCEKLKDVYYRGSEAQKNAIHFESDNRYIRTATWHVNSCIGNENHTYSNACDTNCNICNAPRTITHTFGDYVYNNDATEAKDGTKTRTCSVCKQKETIVAEGTKLEKQLIDSSKTFKDVKANKWYKQYVDYAVTHGIFVGTSANTFSPNTELTRAQFVQVFANISGIDTSKKNVASGFADVPKGKWFTPAVAWAAKNGIVSGVGNGKFDPNAKVTREQMCVMLVNYTEKYLGQSMIATTNAPTFADDKKISSWAKASVYKCAKAGLISGIGNNKFAPKDPATRAQGATIFTFFFKNYINK